MKQTPSEFPGQQSFPGFSLSHWLVFPSLPACSSSSAGLYVLSFPGLPLPISLFIHREDVERDVIKFIWRRLVPIFLSPASISLLSFKSEYPIISLTSLLGYIIFKLMWLKRTLFYKIFVYLASSGPSCGALALCCSMSLLSSCGTQAQYLWQMALVAHSPTRDRICIHCPARWILNHWTTKEGPQKELSNLPPTTLTLGAQLFKGESLSHLYCLSFSHT